MKINFKDSLFAKKTVSSIFESIVIFFILLILFLMAIPNFRHVHKNPVYYKCRGRISMLTGAVEMYNMDNKTIMHSLDQNILLEGKYLKEIINDPKTSCNYNSLGDLQKDGIIYCESHGDINNIIITPEMSLRDYKLEIEKINAENNRIKLKNEKRYSFLFLLKIFMFVWPLSHLILLMLIDNKKAIWGEIIDILMMVIFFSSLFYYLN